MGVLYWLKDSPPPFQKPLSEPVEQKRIPAQKSPLKSTFIKKIASGPKKIQIVKNSKGERYIADGRCESEIYQTGAADPYKQG